MGLTPTSLVERMLAERIGLDPSSVGEALIARGVQARMATLGVRDRQEYDRVLVERLDEVQALVEEVVVPESWFFRDDRPFEVMADFARSGWLADPARSPLKALSLPCAGGEEPYSIAATLLEAGLTADRFRVDAVDVSTRSLARAIAGVYGRNAFRGRASAARSAFFRERDGAFTVEPVLRSGVRFHLGNLLDPSLFADRPPFDVVFCRNLLIYLDGEAKTRAFATLDRLVGPDGMLFLGHADRPDGLEASAFEPTGDRGAFSFRKGSGPPKPSRLALAPKVGPAARGLSRPLVAGQPPRQPSETGPAPMAGPGPRAEGGGVRRNPPVESTPLEPVAAILDQALSLADAGRYVEATALVEGAIGRGAAGAPAYFLLGLIAQEAGDRGRAEAHFLKAIYLDPGHDEALLALALLARRKGDIAAEAAYRKRAGRVLARKAVP